MRKMEDNNHEPKPEIIRNVEQSAIDKNKQDLMKFFNISSKSKVAATVSGLGLILFFVAIYTVSFKNTTFNTLYPKDQSKASETQIPEHVGIKEAGFGLDGPRSVNKGDEFSIDVKVKTATETATIMATQLHYDNTKLEAKNLDDTNSVAKEWIDNQINNNLGMISLVASFPRGITVSQLDQYVKITFVSKETGMTSILIDPTNSHIYRLKDQKPITIESDTLPLSIK